jgi:hypothetical protein
LSYFESHEAAQNELNEFIEDCLIEVQEGNLMDSPDIEDFRIVEV